jgi:hypothetical protein
MYLEADEKEANDAQDIIRFEVEDVIRKALKIELSQIYFTISTNLVIRYLV